MKKILLVPAIILFSASLRAAIHTVSNASHLPAQFSTVQGAADAAADGDTLLVQSTGIPYISLVVNKELHVFGSSSKPAQAAKIESLTLDGSASSESSFTSLQFGSVGSTITDLTGYNDITFRRCHIGAMGLGAAGDLSYTNFLIEGCVFYNDQVFSLYCNNNYSTYTNFVVRNNIFYGYITGITYSTFDHNFFTSTANSNVILQDISYSVVTNNIFYGVSSASLGSNLEIYNNISYGGTDTNFSLGGSNSGANNLNNQDPQVVDVPINQPYSPDFDFSLEAGSPALGVGNDDLNLGALDGTGLFRPDTEPDIPVVREVTIPGGNTVPAEGSFQITIHSVSHQ